jgi:Uma2 family endonuclease
MTTAAARFTAEDLLTLPDAVNYELVDGNLVERHGGAESSAIATAVGACLGAFARARNVGRVFASSCGYQCFRDHPDWVRKPDVSFIRMGRLPEERIPQGHIPIPPDLAVEVVSPGDLAFEIDDKVELYLSAGVRLIWVVSPKTRGVRIHRPKDAQAGPISGLTESQRISGEDVLPGFECDIAEFFKI